MSVPEVEVQFVSLKDVFLFKDSHEYVCKVWFPLLLPIPVEKVVTKGKQVKFSIFCSSSTGG